MDKNMLNQILIMVITTWATWLVAQVIKWVTTGLHYLQDRANETAIGKRLEIDDRFTAKLCYAIECMQPLADDLKAAAADGKLTPEEVSALKLKAWQLFRDSWTVQDLIDFGKSLVPGYTASTDPAAVAAVEEAAKKRFLALQPKVVEDVKAAANGTVRASLPSPAVPAAPTALAAPVTPVNP